MKTNKRLGTRFQNRLARFGKSSKGELSGVVGTGLGIALAISFVVVALLIYGNLSTGAGAWTYGVNNPNTSLLNTSSGAALGQGTVNSAVVTIQSTAMPILLMLGVVAALVLGVLKSLNVF